MIHRRHLICLLGFVSTLPSLYFYAAVGVLYFLALTNIFQAKFRRDHGLLRVALVFVIFAISTFIGIASDQPEARLYLIRALFGIVIIFYFILAVDARDDSVYNAYLLGVFSGLVINSFAVLVFAFSPELFQVLRVDSFSGYDKGARLLRSPGLQSGTDTAGYLSIFGVLLYFYLKQRLEANWIVSRKFFLILLTAPIFCSRSAMLLGVVVIPFLLWRWHIGRVEKVVMVVYAAVLLSAAITVLGLLFFPETISWISASTELISGVPVDAIYAVGDGDSYLAQFDFSRLYSWAPIGDAQLYDNLPGKLLASMGLLGLAVGVVVMGYIVFSLLAIVNYQDRAFVVLFLFIFLFANAKNSYLFYPFFLGIISLLHSRFIGGVRLARSTYLGRQSA